MLTVPVRLMTESDLAAADELRRLAGWNQTQEDWARLLALAPTGCFVAEVGSTIAGTVTTTAYGNTLAWLGMMLVHPQHRRQGIGTALMESALAHLKRREVACIKLDATPAGFPLYTQLGFVAEWTLTRWQLEEKPDLRRRLSSQTRALEDEDWPAIETMDFQVLGASRAQVLWHLARGSASSRVWPAKGPISGWGLLRPGAFASYLGPVVCSNPEGASSLVADLLGACAQGQVFWDIPDKNEVATRLAVELSFQRVRPLTRMRLGSDSSLGGPQAQIGIADPAFG